MVNLRFKLSGVTPPIYGGTRTKPGQESKIIWELMIIGPEEERSRAAAGNNPVTATYKWR